MSVLSGERLAEPSRGPVRILHCHSTFSLGGKEARAVRLMNAFGGAARHTVLSAMPDQLGARAAIDAGVWAEFPVEGRAPALHGKPGPSRYVALASYMQNFDLVLSYNWGAMDAVMAHRLLSRFLALPPLIHHEDGFNADEAEGLNWKRNAFRRAALPTARAVVVPSFVLERTAKAAWGERLPVVRISNGIDVKRYAKPVAGSIPGFERRKGDVVIGTIAGLRTVKDLPTLVRAFAALPCHARLVIVGEGPERSTIVAEAERLGVADRLTMPGFLAQPYRYVGHFDIMALSSLSEQQPIAVMEAMAAGLPVVATAVGDIAEMVSRANRFAIASETLRYREALERLVMDSALRRHVGTANREKALAGFDETSMIAAYARIYGDTVESALPAG